MHDALAGGPAGTLSDGLDRVLTNSYSAPVLLGNPIINEVHVYQKAKHLDGDDSVLRSYWRRLKTVLDLCRRGSWPGASVVLHA